MSAESPASCVTYRSVTVQAGTFSPNHHGREIAHLLEKSKKLNVTFLNYSERIKHGRPAIEQSDEKLDTMSDSINELNNAVESSETDIMRTYLLLNQKKRATDALKKDIENKHKRLEQFAGGGFPVHVTRKLGHAIEELKDERVNLELRLLKVNNDIEDTYESMYELEQRLAALKDLRETRAKEEAAKFTKLRQLWLGSNQRKNMLMSVLDVDTKNIHMEELYISPKQLETLKQEVHDLREKQAKMEAQINCQQQERDYMMSSGQELSQKVFDLEKKVRKEKGDTSWEPHAWDESNWTQDVGGPTIWFSSSTLTAEQVRKLLEEHNRKFKSRTDNHDAAPSESLEVHVNDAHIELHHKNSSPL